MEVRPRSLTQPARDLEDGPRGVGDCDEDLVGGRDERLDLGSVEPCRAVAHVEEERKPPPRRVHEVHVAAAAGGIPDGADGHPGGLETGPDPRPVVVVAEERVEGHVDAEPGQIHRLARPRRADRVVPGRREDAPGLRGRERLDPDHRVPRRCAEGSDASGQPADRVGHHVSSWTMSASA